ncbi:MAG TPA: PP2C family protein-serine/threonine phosphatase [Vicinamibacterales bacterium]|nr:PP2C family protein-serine/threonine phosphatase [Vicinamibacterales bacterium]
MTPVTSEPRRARNTPPRSAREFFEAYTRDLNSRDLERLFTSETAEAYRFFAREIDERELAGLPWHRQAARRAKHLFMAFTARLSPARRALYGVSVLMALFGMVELTLQGLTLTFVEFWPFGFSVPVPVIVFREGTLWLVGGFLLLNLLVLLEVADRLTLKHDLEVARDIQMTMLPREMVSGGGVEAYGFSRPANTVGGDFYDVLQMPDGRLVLALGDVSGKGSPAALLMALVLAILRTLVDEGLSPDAVAQRLNTQVGRHAPGGRFVTLCLAVYDPRTGNLEYVNAGHPPPLLRRRLDGRFERLTEGGIALGMFELAAYTTGRCTLEEGDVLIFYSDGVTEAENAAGAPFDETGLQTVISHYWRDDAATLGRAIVGAVEAHSEAARLADDVTVLAVRRPVPNAEVA